MKKITIITAMINILFAHAAGAQNQQAANEGAAQNFSTSFLVDQTPDDVFKAITNVRGWWSEEVKGGTTKLNDEFMYHFKDVHYCKIKLVEVVPGKKVVWQVLDNRFSFTKDKTEWTGTKMSFEITQKGAQTELRFTHIGLVPEYECYNICTEGWGNYIDNSLKDLIVTGKGHPNPKEGGYNARLLEKWTLRQ
jgi:uncharacterized protein YndB with AHSA1/START domain